MPQPASTPAASVRYSSRPAARGNTIVELTTVLAVMAILAAVAVPSAAATRRALAGSMGARRLAVVLRAAQAQAQSRSCRVDVVVGSGGRFEVRSTYGVGEWGDLGVSPQSNYPGMAVSFNGTGSPCLYGSATPRAGSFVFGGGAGKTVVVQLGGCIRCR